MIKSKSNTGHLMQITLNGESRDIAAGMTVADLLRDIGIEPRKVAVERNLEIVSKSSYDTTPVEDGDKFEIVHFIGGGAPSSQN